MQTAKPRATPVDAAILLGLAGLILFILYSAQRTMGYEWNWSLLVQYLVRFDEQAESWVPGLLLEGLFTTLRLAVWSIVLASLLGACMGILRSQSGLFGRLLGRCYVELVRNTPPLVLIFIVYFFLSSHVLALLEVDRLVYSAPAWAQALMRFFMAPPGQMSTFVSALVTLAIYEGAYITEHVRAGLESVEPGQIEAARALGLTPVQSMRYITGPQAFSRIIPPLAGQFISTIKDSAIVSVISIQELTFQGMELMAASYLTFEIWLTVLVLYMLLTVPCSFAARRVEKYMNRARA